MYLHATSQLRKWTRQLEEERRGEQREIIHGDKASGPTSAARPLDSARTTHVDRQSVHALDPAASRATGLTHGSTGEFLYVNESLARPSYSTHCVIKRVVLILTR